MLDSRYSRRASSRSRPTPTTCHLAGMRGARSTGDSIRAQVRLRSRSHRRLAPGGRLARDVPLLGDTGKVLPPAPQAPISRNFRLPKRFELIDLLVPPPRKFITQPARGVLPQHHGPDELGVVDAP